MTVKEYLRQAYRLDQKISSNLEEVARLRTMAGAISISRLGEKVQSSRRTEAPYVRTVEKIMQLEDKINCEVDTLVDLKSQIHDMISAVPQTDERLVLSYRYIHNMTWEQIGHELCADARTVRRWHDEALIHVVLPENPIEI